PADGDEESGIGIGRGDLLRRNAQRGRALAVQPLRPVEQGGVSTSPHVGDDLGGPRESIGDLDAGHGTSLSTGTTRIDVAPAALSGASRSHTRSASIAAWIAICPGSASSSTDGAPMLGSTARISGSSAAGGS